MMLITEHVRMGYRKLVEEDFRRARYDGWAMTLQTDKFGSECPQ